MSNYGTPPPPPPPPPPPFGGFEKPGYGAATTAGPLASWIQRVGANLVDSVLVLPFSVMQNVFTPKADSTGTMVGGNLALASLFGLLGIAVVVYNRWYLGGQGQSFGKKQLGLTLVSESTGQPIGMLKAFLRDLAHVVDSIICFVGYLFPLWDKKRQTIADKIMATVVTARA